jgi:cytochrome c-type biogenesis protein CcmH
VRALALIAALLCCLSAAIARDAASLGDPKVEERLRIVSQDLRCLVCQNQTLADSNAELAEDLRQEIRGQIRQGKSDDEIRAYLVARYGDFVLYRPPLKGITVLLWVGPFALMAGGLVIAFIVLRRRKFRTAHVLDDEARKRLAAQLNE